EPIWVVRVDQDRLVALDGVCTHVRCVLAWNRETGTLDCPCHRGAFDLNGNVLEGPPRQALARHRVETQLGQVYVRL
ncbi:MAG: Rieske (2Fe-2S) protein, partial [Deltaproteobacteria bacterium]|nr:Rieske (2Fe-2S) protein [Deltaproteobacteria bacterium]